VCGDRREEVVAAGGDRELGGVGQRGDGLPAAGDASLGGRELGEQARVGAGIGTLAGGAVDASP
jgi:hypothetical protein